MNADTLAWWLLLRSEAALNVVLWGGAAWALSRLRDRWPPGTWLTRRWQLLLSAGSVLGCGYRSLLPVFDVQRRVLAPRIHSHALASGLARKA